MQNKLPFNAESINKGTLSIALFRTEWNGACQIVSMIYEGLAKSYQEDADFFTVDFEKQAALSREFGVTEVPTILFFKSGVLLDYAVGLTAKNTLISKIESALNAPDNLPSTNI